MNFIAPTAEERRARNKAQRERHGDMLSAIIDAATMARAGMAHDGHDWEGEDNLALLRAIYAMFPYDEMWKDIGEVERAIERNDPDYRDALGFSAADGARIKDDRNREAA